MKSRFNILTFLFIGIAISVSFYFWKLRGAENNKNYTCKISGSSVSFDMIYITGGEFEMGSPENEVGHKKDESPIHKVKVSPFWIGKCEVTWDEFECYAFRQDTGSSGKTISIDAVTRPSPSYEPYDHGWGRGKMPAMGISWYAAKQYCEWLSLKTGETYRLPTEAEWEFACRAGNTGKSLYVEDSKQLDQFSWFKDNSNGKTHQVGLKKPNAFGIFDMLGNVWELTQDFYDPDYYNTFKDVKIIVDPKGPKEGLDPVLKGGCWNDPPSELRFANRKELPFEWWERDPQRPRGMWWMIDGQYVGFRVVRQINP